MKKLLLIIYLLIPLCIYTDEIQLTSGEIINGEIISMDENIVTIRTDYGKLEIEREFVSKGIFYTTSPVPLSGLIFEFLFNGSMQDSSQNKLFLENYNNTGFGTGPDNLPNNSITSDGTGQYLVLKTCPEADNTNTFSISFWIKIAAYAKNQYMISKWSTSEGETAEGKFAISYKNGTVYFYIVDTDGYYHLLKADNAFDINTWTHLVFICSPGYMAIFVNSEKKAEGSYDFTGLKYDESPVYILTAKSNTSTPWAYYNAIGSMDNLRMYNYILSDEEIISLLEEFGSYEE